MANPVGQSELMKALDALILQEDLTLSEDDITVNRLMERAKWGKKKAQDAIEKWMSEGKLEYLGKRRKTRQRVDAWRLVIEATQPV